MSFDMGAWVFLCLLAVRFPAPPPRQRSIPCTSATSALGSLCFRVVRHDGVGLPYAFVSFNTTGFGSPSLRVIQHVALGPSTLRRLASSVPPPAGRVLSLSVYPGVGWFSSFGLALSWWVLWAVSQLAPSAKRSWRSGSTFLTHLVGLPLPRSPLLLSTPSCTITIMNWPHPAGAGRGLLRRIEPDHISLTSGGAQCVLISVAGSEFVWLRWWWW
jgi:hypothetical protein